MARGVRLHFAFDTRAARMAFQHVRNLGEDPQGLMEVAGIILESSVRNRFDRGVGPGGVPWRPSKRVLKFGGKTLVNFGNLLGSLRYEAESNKVTIGFDGLSESAKNAASHQFGVRKQTVRVRHARTQTMAFGVPMRARVVQVRGHVVNMNLPARPMLGVDQQDRADLIDGWRDYVRTLLK